MVMAEGLHERIAAELRSLDGHDMTDGEYIDALADAVGSGASGTLHERLADLVEPQLPESVEWPRFEDGTPVGIGDDVSVGGEAWKVRCAILREKYWALSVERDYDTATVRGDYGERVKRPTHKVLDADGAPIEVGDTVYFVDGNRRALIVERIDANGSGPAVDLVYAGERIHWYSANPEKLTHERPDSWRLWGEDLDMAVKVGEVDKVEMTRRAKKLAKAGEGL